MPPESSAINDALIAVLQGDATLDALAPDGVWLNAAPGKKRRFIIVSLVESLDTASFGRRAVETAIYLVKIVIETKVDDAAGHGVAEQGAARIDALLEDQILTVPGYAWSTVHRVNRQENTEDDEVDRLIRYEHRGGHYRVQLSIV